MSSPHSPPTRSAAPPSLYEFEWGPEAAIAREPRRNSTNLSPPLIAMVAVLGTALLIVLYTRVLSGFLRRLRRSWRLWRRRRRFILSVPSASSLSDLDSPPPPDYLFSLPYGLDDSAIKSLPLWIYNKQKSRRLSIRECAVCLLEFEEDDSLRTLPSCAHSFHADCIDAWLRAHATCPLCRSAVILPAATSASPFVPLRASRIRPSLDDILLDPPPAPAVEFDPEIAPVPISPEGQINRRYSFLLKRSYSFGFERIAMLEAATASPWRSYRDRRSFWSKRWPSPFGSSSAPRSSRVFSFRSHRGVSIKSPFTRQRGYFFSLSSEPNIRFASGVGPSSRRSRSMASTAAGFSSSRTRSGDPEALLSPERLTRR